MEILIQDVNWVSVVVGASLSFGMGWLWYSDMLFGKVWRDGIGIDFSNPPNPRPMWQPMLAQAGSTFMFAWVIVLIISASHIYLAILVTLTIAGFTKANGMFAQKDNYAISVDVGYVLAMFAVVIAANAIL